MRGERVATHLNEDSIPRLKGALALKAHHVIINGQNLLTCTARKKKSVVTRETLISGFHS